MLDLLIHCIVGLTRLATSYGVSFGANSMIAGIT